MASPVSFFKHVLVAPFERDIDAVLASTTQYPADKIVLLVPTRAAKHAHSAIQTVEHTKIPCETVPISDETDFEEVFGVLNDLRKKNTGQSVVLDLGNAGGLLSNICLCYAHLYGIDAIQTVSGKTIEYPVAGTAFCEFVKGKKLDILTQIAKKDCCDSMEDVSRKLSLSASLVSYHLYGTAKNSGLIELGLVEPHRNKNKIVLRLTLLGKLIAQQHAQSR
ncbi:MAG: hypothetical protein Q7R47_06565 [Candidatus Diapherotrites archaeon]|nr:hypothetical protein [Candidatus Diapherotrites archaeon]